MLHGDYYERTLGTSVRAEMFKWTKQADPDVLTFVNDYDILAGGLTNCYKHQVADLLKQGAPIDGIGIQSHFKGPSSNIDPVQVQERLDTLAELGLPLWITEFDVSKSDPKERAKYLSYFLRATFSHKAIDGIILWGFWDDRHWRGVEASIVDGPDFTLNAAGDQFRELVYKEWWTTSEISSNTSQTRVFKGKYDITVLNESGEKLETKSVEVISDTSVCFGECN